MRKILALLLTLAALPHWSFAAPGGGSTPTPNPKPTATPVRKAEAVVRPTPEAIPEATPEPTPKPKKASLFHRLLYGTPPPQRIPRVQPTPKPKPKYKKAAAPAVSPAPASANEENIPPQKAAPTSKVTPAPKASPTAKPSPAPKASATPKTSPTPKASPTPKRKPTPMPAPAATLSPKPKSKAGKQTPNLRGDIPFVPENSVSAESKPAPELSSLLEQDAKDRARLREVKSAALDDGQVKALKDKADAASDSDQRATSKEYYKALYEKMRSLEPALKDRIDRMENVMMRRIDGASAEH